MTTAYLLHFDDDVATMVRWIGGPHVDAHLTITAILAMLHPIVVPALCNAPVSESNFQVYLKYGSHQSVIL